MKILDLKIREKMNIGFENIPINVVINRYKSTYRLYEYLYYDESLSFPTLIFSAKARSRQRILAYFLSRIYENRVIGFSWVLRRSGYDPFSQCEDLTDSYNASFKHIFDINLENKNGDKD